MYCLFLLYLSSCLCKIMALQESPRSKGAEASSEASEDGQPLEDPPLVERRVPQVVLASLAILKRVPLKGSYKGS